MPRRRLSAHELTARGYDPGRVRDRRREEQGARAWTERGAAAVAWVERRLLPGTLDWGILYTVGADGTDRSVRDEADARALVDLSDGREPRLDLEWHAWGESLVPHVQAVAARARADGYRGDRLRTTDREAVERKFGHRFTDPELRAARQFWRSAMDEAARPRPSRRRGRGPAPAAVTHLPASGASPAATSP